MLTPSPKTDVSRRDLLVGIVVAAFVLGTIEQVLRAGQDVSERTKWLFRLSAYELSAVPNDIVAGYLGLNLSGQEIRERVRVTHDLTEYPGAVAVYTLKRMAFGDPDWYVRLHATHGVARAAFDSQKEIAFFKKKTDDPNNGVAMAAYYELALVGDMSGREPALLTISQSTMSIELVEAMQVVGAVGNTADVKLVKGIQESTLSSDYIKAAASRAKLNIFLAQVPKEKRLDYLIQSLDSSDAWVRDWAFTWLWRFQDPNTTSRLHAYRAETGHRGYDEATRALISRSTIFKYLYFF